MANDKTAELHEGPVPQPEPMLGGVKKMFASLLNRNAPGVQAGAQAGVGAAASAASRELNTLFGALRRIDALILAEDDRAVELTERLKEAETERVDALTAARLGGGGGSQRIEKLSATRDALRGQIADAEAVASKMRVERLEFAARIDPLKRAYRAEVDAFLTVLYGRLMLRYVELAPEIAATVLQVAAVRRVMISHRCGNSNGWSGEVLLPGMKPGVGASIPPILAAGSREFDQAATNAESEVLETVHEAGFLYGIECK